MEVPSDKKIILFDGVCNLCNGSVLFVIRRDKKDIFRFAALQSKIGLELSRDRSIDTSRIDSILLLDPNLAYYTKSSAVLKIGQALGGGWRLLALLEWIPPVIRDFFYDIIAKNRYRWFGRKESCMVPTPELLTKFLG